MNNRQRNFAKQKSLAKERRRRQKPEPTPEELTPRQINRLLREQEQYLRQQSRGLTLRQDKESPSSENFQRRVAMATKDPILQKPLGKAKFSKRKIRRKNYKQNILMREIIRPFPQGRRLFLTRIPTAKNPLTYKEYQQYLRSEHWNQFRSEYEESDVRHECYVCGDLNYDLHHWTYDRIGKEKLTDVIPLCRKHHEATHKIVKQGLSLDRAHTYTRERYLKGQL